MKRVENEINSIFDETMKTCNAIFRRFLVDIPARKGAVFRSLIENAVLTRQDLPLIESFFEREHQDIDWSVRNMVINIEDLLVSRLEQLWFSQNSVDLVSFLVELTAEQTKYYKKYSDRRLKIESDLTCTSEYTDFLPQDLEKVGSLNLPTAIMDHDREILATLHRIMQKNSQDLIFVTIDYYMVHEKTRIEEGLGFKVSDPLYAFSTYPKT